MNMKRLRLTLISITLLLPLSFGLQAAGDAAAGKGKAQQCAGCHGANGEGNGTDKTTIGGMDVGKFSKSINAYKKGERRHMMMEMFAKKLNDQDIADLAAYYAAK